MSVIHPFSHFFQTEEQAAVRKQVRSLSLERISSVVGKTMDKTDHEKLRSELGSLWPLVEKQLESHHSLEFESLQASLASEWLQDSNNQQQAADLEARVHLQAVKREISAHVAQEPKGQDPSQAAAAFQRESTPQAQEAKTSHPLKRLFDAVLENDLPALQRLIEDNKKLLQTKILLNKYYQTKHVGIQAEARN